MSIGVVISTYNRRNNLAYTLQSLAWQTRQDFHVIVADDGSTDGTREMIERLMQEAVWQTRLQRIDCGPNRGAGRQGRARNRGAAHLPEDCTFMILLDSDMILNTDVIERYAQAHAKSPTAILMGVIDWLPPLAFSEIAQILQEGGVEALRLNVPKTPARRIEGTMVGPELRGEAFQPPFDALHPLRPVSPSYGLTANVGYPLQVFRELGGFDEAMVGYGYEDIELGVRAYKKGIQALFHSGIWSLHIWHPKDDPVKSAIENQRNFDYHIRKHGLDIDDQDGSLDWAYWGHYHRLRGGKIISSENELWAINARGTYRLSLPGPDWIKRLGFLSVEDVRPVHSSDIAHIPIAVESAWYNVPELVAASPIERGSST